MAYTWNLKHEIFRKSKKWRCLFWKMSHWNWPKWSKLPQIIFAWKYLNHTRFARNVAKWDSLSDFQTLCLLPPEQKCVYKIMDIIHHFFFLFRNSYTTICFANFSPVISLCMKSIWKCRSIAKVYHFHIFSQVGTHLYPVNQSLQTSRKTYQTTKMSVVAESLLSRCYLFNSIPKLEIFPHR